LRRVDGVAKIGSMHSAPVLDRVLLGVYASIYVVLVVGIAGVPWSPDWFTPGTLSFEVVKGLPAAFIALVAGAIASGIAYRQWVTADRQREINAAKLSLDLFEQRYKLYELLWRYLSERTRDLDTLTSASVELQNSAPKFYFLFGKEIGKFVEEAQSRGIRQDAAHQAGMRFRTPGDVRLAEELPSHLQWFYDEASGLRDRFAGYLDFERWR
jgi:hypothetical protein